MVEKINSTEIDRQTAEDDSRNVRHQIASQNGPNLLEHITESNRITNELAAQLGVI